MPEEWKETCVRRDRQMVTNMSCEPVREREQIINRARKQNLDQIKAIAANHGASQHLELVFVRDVESRLTAILACANAQD